MNAPLQTAAPRVPAWATAILWLAAVYNVLAGAVGIAIPNVVFEQAGMKLPEHVEFFQALCAVALVFGLGYGLAASNPVRHWPIVVLGLLSKIAVPAVMAAPLINKTLPLKFGYMIAISDLAWWIPFALVLVAVRRAIHPRAATAHAGAPASSTSGSPSTPSDRTSPDAPSGSEQYQAAEAAALSAVTRQATLHRGHMLSALSLRELSDKTPTLVVFLRHAGCTFCRETLANLAKSRKDIEARGLTIVVVHMSTPAGGNKMLARFGLDEPEPLWHISDPEQRLYKSFELARGKFSQLLGLKDIGRFIKVGILRGHFFGLPKGDTRQLGGVFIFYRRRILKSFRAARSSDELDVGGVSACRIEPDAPAPAAAPVTASAPRPRA